MLIIVQIIVEFCLSQARDLTRPGQGPANSNQNWEREWERETSSISVVFQFHAEFTADICVPKGQSMLAWGPEAIGTRFCFVFRSKLLSAHALFVPVKLGALYVSK